MQPQEAEILRTAEMADSRLPMDYGNRDQLDSADGLLNAFSIPTRLRLPMGHARFVEEARRFCHACGHCQVFVSGNPLTDEIRH